MLMYAWLALQAVPSQAEEAKSNAALNPDEWRSFKVMKKWPVTHNTEGFRYTPRCESIPAAAPGIQLASLMLIWRCKEKLMPVISLISWLKLFGTCRFAFENPKQESGLHVASCLLTRAPIGGEKEDGTKKFVIR